MPYVAVATMGSAVDDVLRTTDAVLFDRRTRRTMPATGPGWAGDPSPTG